VQREYVLGPRLGHVQGVEIKPGQRGGPEGGEISIGLRRICMSLALKIKGGRSVTDQGRGITDGQCPYKPTHLSSSAGSMT
jgi:hypothetical protein